MGDPDVNFYKRHLGDIAKACGHLSQAQMGAYDLLLDWLYGNEKPLPNSKEALHRIARAVTKAERVNVDLVIGEFFVLTPEGYTQKRAGEEIAKANAQAETNRRIAEEREARRRARLEHESCNEPHNDSCTNGQPSQTPDTRLQTPEENNTPPTSSGPPADAGSKPLSVKDLQAEGVDVAVAADWLRVRKAKRAPLTRTALEAIKREAAKGNLSLAEAVKIAAERGWQGFNAEWIQDKSKNPERPKPRALTCSVVGCQKLWVGTRDQKPFCKTHLDEIYAAQDSARSPPPAAIKDLVGKVAGSFGTMK